MSEASAHAGSLSQAEGALVQAASRVGEARSDLLALADQLSAQLESLRGQWSGTGASAFGRVHLAWQEKQRRIIGALDGLASALVETDRATTAADASQGDAMSRTAARLSGI